VKIKELLMSSLKGRSPSSAYQELLKVTNPGTGLDATLRNVEDGAGNPSGLQLGTNAIGLYGYHIPANGFAANKVLRINPANNAFEWHCLIANDINGLANVATSGDYNDLVNTPILNFDGGDASTNALFYQIVVIDGGTS
jgi:hypothetical protein